MNRKVLIEKIPEVCTVNDKQPPRCCIIDHKAMRIKMIITILSLTLGLVASPSVWMVNVMYTFSFYLSTITTSDVFWWWFWQRLNLYGHWYPSHYPGVMKNVEIASLRCICKEKIRARPQKFALFTSCTCHNNPNTSDGSCFFCESSTIIC